MSDNTREPFGFQPRDYSRELKTCPTCGSYLLPAIAQAMEQAEPGDCCIICRPHRDAFIAGFKQAALRFSSAGSIEALEEWCKYYTKVSAGKTLEEQALECWRESKKR